MSIKIDLKIILFGIFFFVAKQLNDYLLVLFFALCHECVHIIVALGCGVNPAILTINPFGCSVSFIHKQIDYDRKVLNGNVTDVKKIIIYMVGPVFNLVFAILANMLRSSSNIVYVNLGLFLFNLLPVYPLDGGRIIKSSLQLMFGRKIAYKMILKISKFFSIVTLVCGSFLILKYNNIGILFICVYVFWLNIKASKILKIKLRVVEIIEKKEDPVYK